MNSMQLICLPFAGGNKYSYRKYEEVIPSFLRMRCLEYPGRGTRMNEALLDGIDLLVEDIYRQADPMIQGGSDYAIYGHSMGGLLAFLLTRKIVEADRNAPRHVFITGTPGPAAPCRTERKKHLLPKNEFAREVIKLDNSNQSVFKDAELWEMMEPIIRNDFSVSERYVHFESDPLPVRFTVITGTEEEMTDREIAMWQDISMFPVEFLKMPGKHFFIFNHAKAISEIITKTLFTHSNVSI